MPIEPTELVEARAHLERFESRMQTPEGLVHLSEGLALLQVIRTDGTSERLDEIAFNLALAYAKKVQCEVESLLSREHSIHLDVFGQWLKVFAEFDQAGFTLPQEVTNARSKLWDRTSNKYLKQLSPSERKDLFERLNALGDK